MSDVWTFLKGSKSTQFERKNLINFQLPGILTVGNEKMIFCHDTAILRALYLIKVHLPYKSTQFVDWFVRIFNLNIVEVDMV